MKMHQSTLLGLFVLLSALSGSYCGKVLVVPADGSHWINMKVLIVELRSKGHNITVVRGSSSWYIEEESPHYTSITVDTGEFDSDFWMMLLPRLLQIKRHGKSFWSEIEIAQDIFSRFSEVHRQVCNMTAMIFENEILMNSLEDNNYDLVLTDPAFGGGVLLAHRLGLPLVLNVRWTMYGEGHFVVAPSPLSYIPIPALQLTDKMTFSQRVMNVMVYLIFIYQNPKFFGCHYQEFSQKYFGPNVDFFSLLQDADIWLMRNDFTFEFARPTMPNVVYMGGFQCKPAKPLPDDLEKLVQSSGEHGLIIMSLGSVFGQLLSEINDEIAAAFAQLPQKVIWRHTGPRPANLGNNTLIMDWLPQNDLLGHPQTKLFVAHGGTNGVQEAIYHGVPIVGLPISFDQPDNLSRMQAKGTAKIVDFATLDRTVFLEALTEVLHNPFYKENIQRLSKLHHDQPMKPLDRAVFWIEFVMRNRGAPHLRTQAYRMSWIEYHSIDVILSLLAIVLLVPLIITFIIKLVWYKGFYKNNTKM
ncbi:UDP-glucuronosyltransferase 2A3-like isoform X1 [Carassius gibelio]|uniref:UDP-glucuronosyltransferase 2A3-like isoform X1 n=2 Tax=Carassius gibelio TaxID=101364 RepID=UPI002277D3A4|nr:UDP-glucuronosyltransferase 2A3-like isoform X1 [Carassius gibelio]